MKKLQQYNKFLIAVVGLILTLLAPTFGGNQTYQVIVGIVTALGIYHVPNAAPPATPPPAAA